MLLLVDGKRIVPTVLDTTSYPALERLLGNNASAHGISIRENDGETNFHLDLGAERAERNVLRNLEAPDVVGGGNRDFDDYLPVDGVPAM